MSYDNHIVDFFPTLQAAFVYCESKLIRIYFFDSFQQRQPPIIAKWSSTSTLHRTGAKTANGISRPLPTSVGSWCQHLCPRNCDRSTMCAVCQSARMMKFKWVSKLWRWKRRKKKIRTSSSWCELCKTRMCSKLSTKLLPRFPRVFSQLPIQMCELMDNFCF